MSLLIGFALSVVKETTIFFMGSGALSFGIYTMLRHTHSELCVSPAFSFVLTVGPALAMAGVRRNRTKTNLTTGFLLVENGCDVVGVVVGGCVLSHRCWTECNRSRGDCRDAESKPVEVLHRTFPEIGVRALKEHLNCREHDIQPVDWEQQGTSGTVTEPHKLLTGGIGSPQACEAITSTKRRTLSRGPSPAPHAPVVQW
jgi:hypothetical protein